VFDARTRANLGAMAIIVPDGVPSSRYRARRDYPRDHSGCKPGFVATRQ
jgi:hypothetical protein